MTIGSDSTIANYLVQNPEMAKTQVQTGEVSESKARDTAQKFEALLLQTMLKAMRKTTPGNTLFGSSQADMYLEMFDKQIASDVSRNSSLGIADAVYRQLVPAGKTGNRPLQEQALQGLPLETHTANSAVRQNAMQADLHANVPATTAAENFVSRISQKVKSTAQELGTTIEAIMAIAALETGWGSSIAQHTDGRSTNNLFGIKADSGWTGKTESVITSEFERGTVQSGRALFRAYETELHSIQDFGNFIRHNPRYQAAIAVAGDPEHFIQEIHKAGYATDPDYSQKVIAVMHEINSMHASGL